MKLYLDDYVINFEKLKLEDKDTQDFIKGIYNDMIRIYKDFCQGHYTTNIGDIENVMKFYYNTLYHNNYIVDVRDMKLEELLKK